MLRSLDKMRGHKLQARDGDIGHVDDFYFDDQSWTIRYLVVDTGPWLFGRKVLISPLAVAEAHWAGEKLPVDLTKEQVKESPEVDLEQPVSRQEEEALHSYYGWNPYWLGLQMPTAFGGAAAVPPAESGLPDDVLEAERQPVRSHLRSADEVIHYDIQARDGKVGHVADFLVEESSWMIRYVVVNTHDWLPHRDVLVATHWIESIDWGAASAFVNLEKEAIKNSPPYDPAAPVEREDEARLHRHYGRSGYWES